MRILRPGIGVLVLAVIMGSGFLCTAQTTTPPSRNPGPPSAQSPNVTDIDGVETHDTASEGMRAQLEKMRNDDRQKQLVDDTNKLLSLATELKTDVDKTNKDTLSLDVIKKADEIEKLAHNVKEKMKGN